MRGAFVLVSAVLASCIDTVSLDNAACPCTEGYYCADDGICRNNADVVSFLEGKSYIIETETSDWTEPPGLAAVLYPNDRENGYPVFAYEILEVDPRKMTFLARMGIAKDGEQNKGLKTFDMTGTLDVLDDGTVSFVLGPEDILSILIGPKTDEGDPNNTLIWYYGLTVSGQVTDHGRTVIGGTLATVINFDEIYDLFFLAKFTSGAELCKEIEPSLHLQCGVCPANSNEPYCMTFRAENLEYPLTSNLTVEPVYNFDVKYL